MSHFKNYKRKYIENVLIINYSRYQIPRKETETTAFFESLMTVRIIGNSSCHSRQLLLRMTIITMIGTWPVISANFVTNYFSFLCFLFFSFLLTHICLHNACILKCPTSFNIGTSKVVILFYFFLMLLQMCSYLFSVSAYRYNIITLSLSFVDLYTL